MEEFNIKKQQIAETNRVETTSAKRRGVYTRIAILSW